MKLEKKMNKYLLVTFVLLFVFPTIAFSQFTTTVIACDLYSSALIGSDFKCTVMRIISLIGVLIPILIALAFVVFFWGLSKFILHSDSKADIDKGRNYMLWGIIALFLLIAFRAIVGFISMDLGLGYSTDVPTLPTGGGTP